MVDDGDVAEKSARFECKIKMMRKVDLKIKKDTLKDLPHVTLILFSALFCIAIFLFNTYIMTLND